MEFLSQKGHIQFLHECTLASFGPVVEKRATKIMFTHVSEEEETNMSIFHPHSHVLSV